MKGETAGNRASNERLSSDGVLVATASDFLLRWERSIIAMAKVQWNTNFYFSRTTGNFLTSFPGKIMQLLISCIDDPSLWKHDLSPNVIISHLYATDTFHHATDKVFQCSILAGDESGSRIIIIKKLCIYVAARNFISFDTQLIISVSALYFLQLPG